MKSKVNGLRLTILAALGFNGVATLGGGLITGCQGRLGGTGNDSSSGDGSGDSADSADTGEDEGEGEGEGDEGEDGPPPPVYECENPEPIMQMGTDVPSGFVRCADGFIHRTEAVTCLAPQGADSEACAGSQYGCSSSADCNEDSHGSCIDDPWGDCLCHYGCETDADCEDGYVCACAGVMAERATCLPSNCTTDDSCQNGLCGLSHYEGCCGDSYEVMCAANDGPCHVDTDCGAEPCYEGGEATDFQCTTQDEYGTPDESWRCEAPGWCGCDCGRPFFVEGEARTAPAVGRDDWTRRFEPSALDEVTRARLANYWTEIGRFEHASVASFARFCLQLMHLGAPPELLAENQQAMADEIEHARLAFGLATRYANSPVGPGRLDVETSLTRALSPYAIVEGLVVEACVGETLAAIEAQEAAAQAQDPVVAAALDQIARDELRHAQLGWRSLRWILEQSDDHLRRFALTVLDSAMRAVTSEHPTDGIPRSLRAHGLLDDELRAEVRQKAVESLVVPCLAALQERFEGVQSMHA